VVHACPAFHRPARTGLAAATAARGDRTDRTGDGTLPFCYELVTL
jgi:hypothetical protein